jgi:hypothetical protein
LQKYGITNGSDEPEFGLELEAIGQRGSQAADFRRVVVNALEPHLDKERRQTKDLNIQTAGVVYYGVEELVEQITADMISRLREHGAEIVQAAAPTDSVTNDPNNGTVSASVDLDAARQSDSDLVPEPLDFDDYLEAVIEGGDSPLPDNEAEKDELMRLLLEEIRTEDGNLDLEELINLDI